MTRFQQFAARVRALLSADTDQALVRARTDGEKLVALLRLGFILVFSAVTLADPSPRKTWFFELAIMGLSVGYAVALLMVATKSTKTWVPWMTSAVDVTLISTALATYVAGGNPLGALNNRVFFETYFFAVITSALRYDWRLSAFTVLLAIGQFLGITFYVSRHWDLATLENPLTGSFHPIVHTLRIFLLAAVGASSVTVARWARHLRLMVGTDHLTGLSQRRPFFERLEEELNRSTSQRSTLSLALLDVDEFKKFNDTYGHLAGDRALQLLAGRLKKLVRTTDLVARFGGEEFVIAFPRMDIERAVRRVDELREELASVALPVGGTTRHLTVSAGIGSWPADGENFEDVFAEIDKRLYEAKRQGRNRAIGPPNRLRPVV